jgi:hypothetical protein
VQDEGHDGPGEASGADAAVAYSAVDPGPDREPPSVTADRESSPGRDHDIDEPVPSTHGDVEPETRDGMEPADAAARAPGVTAGRDFAPMAGAPRFVLDADRAARWRRPRVRAALFVVAGVAASVLALQVAIDQHDALAARWPSLQPALAAVCATAGCAIEPPRRIEALSVESSSLVRSPEGGGIYRLAVVLRNRERLAVRAPAVELSLTDALGQTVARRVLDPVQLGASDAPVAPGAELTLATLLRAADPAVTGYTIEIFYP